MELKEKSILNQRSTVSIIVSKSHLKLSREQQVAFISSLTNRLEKLLEKKPRKTHYDAVAGDDDYTKHLRDNNSEVKNSEWNKCGKVCIKRKIPSA